MDRTPRSNYPQKLSPITNTLKTAGFPGVQTSWAGSSFYFQPLSFIPVFTLNPISAPCGHVLGEKLTCQLQWGEGAVLHHQLHQGCGQARGTRARGEIGVNTDEESFLSPVSGSQGQSAKR